MKKYLLTGLAILLPVAMTLAVTTFLFHLFTTPFLNFVGKLLAIISAKVNLTFSPNLTIFISRILALVLLCAFIFLLGLVTRWFLIKNILSITHQILLKIPFIKTVYKVFREIISALFSADGKKAFKYPVIIPFPNHHSYSLGFQAGEVAKEIQEKLSQTPLISVFVPTSPHPISGFLFLIPKIDVHKLDMTNEDAVKYLVSCGLIRPDVKVAQQASNENF